MRYGQWQRHQLRTYQFWAFHPVTTPSETSLIQDSFQRAELFGFFQEQADGLFQVLQSQRLCRAARGDIEFRRVRDVRATILENLGGELDFHTCSPMIRRAPVAPRCSAERRN